MRMLVVAAVAALALGFTIKDLGTSSGSSPDDAWGSRAEEANTVIAENPLTGDTHEKLTESGEWLKEWLLEHAAKQ